MGNTDGLLETTTKVITRMTKGTFMERCTGMMVVSTRVNGAMEFNMATVR